jgi:predicted transposase YbfD/YdcC
LFSYASYLNEFTLLVCQKKMTRLMQHFETLTDPRMERRKLHKLHDIIFITIAAVICGCDEWNDIEEFGQIRNDWLKTILELPHGIPSHDTFNRVFSLLDPQQLQQCFSNWVQSVAQISEGSIISIDGKRMCNSGEGGSKAIIHMISAWSSANNMVLAQQKVNDKSNEIAAIPALLLDLLDIKGCLVTIDAMGCQHDIAKKIISKEADYILAVKNNQEHLYDDLQEAFEQDKHVLFDAQVHADYGRIEKRKCSIITDTDWICKQQNWTNLHTLIKIDRERSFKGSDLKSEVQTRYYISSHAGNAAFFNHVVRAHWGIENKLHWTLDVAFGEDKSTKQAGNAAENFSFINKIALNLLKQHDDRRGAQRVSIKTKRKKCGWDKNYLLKVLNTSN